MAQSPEDLSHVKVVLETALLTSSGPLPVSDLCRLFDPPISADVARRALDDLHTDWQDRGVELVKVAGGWRFQSRATDLPRYKEILISRCGALAHLL